MVRSGVNGTTSNTNHPTSNATSNHAMRYLVIYLVYKIYMYNIYSLPNEEKNYSCNIWLYTNAVCIKMLNTSLQLQQCEQLNKSFKLKCRTDKFRTTTDFKVLQTLK